jgi:short-subunit dehydrogenase
MIQVNLITLTQLTKHLLDEMRKQRYGRILNVGSTGSFIPTPLSAVYAATKAYVWSFSSAIAEELGGSGVTVTILCPGATRTEFQKRAQIEDIQLLRSGVMDAQTVARIGYRGMMAGRRVVVPGLFNQALVFFSRIIPESLVTGAAKTMMARSEGRVS